MPPSIAEGPEPAPLPAPAPDPAGAARRGRRRARGGPWLVGLAIALGAFALYAVSNLVHDNPYNHFVWQADAFLHGRAWIPYPVAPGGSLPQNWYLQDVYPLQGADGLPTGRALLPFPPLPAIVLLPLVAVFGLAADQELVALLLGAAGVGLAWWMLGGLRLRTAVRATTTLVLATGTTWWWATATGSTWYLAHLVAGDLALVAVGIALRNDPRAPGGVASAPEGESTPRARWSLDRSQVLAGFLLGLAVTARLPLLFAAPFLALVGGGGSLPRRTASAAVGGVLPVAALLAYTFLTSGSLVHPGYAYQYRLEVRGYPTLGYHADWNVEDPRYIPQNLRIALASVPVLFPDHLPNTLGVYPDVPVCTDPGQVRSLFDGTCPIAVPVDVGTSVLLSSPGLLLALLAIRRHGTSRLALGTAGAVILVAAVNLAHFSQGWVQWGYRFSLDFLPFLLPMVALGAARPADGRLRLSAFVLFVAGAAINLWGVTWGHLLAW